MKEMRSARDNDTKVRANDCIELALKRDALAVAEDDITLGDESQVFMEGTVA